jgi:hypothetical protein
MLTKLTAKSKAHTPAKNRNLDKAKVAESEQRPKDVVAARDTFTLTNYAPIGVKKDELSKGGALVKEALGELGEPHIFVNRSLRSALRLLQKGGEFTTIHDKPKDPKLGADSRAEIEAYLTGRRHHEQSLGTYGEGELEGRTVYGSLGFSEQIGAELWEDGILTAAKAKAEPDSTHLNAGIALTGGAVTFVLKAEENERSTFLPSDTYDTHGEKPVAEEHLPFAIWANIGTKGDSYFNSDQGSQVLLQLPKDQAIHGIKRFLTSEAINRGYMEAQVRGATLDDVERIVVRRKYADVGGVTEFGNFEESLAEVKRLAKERGIPLAEA